MLLRKGCGGELRFPLSPYFPTDSWIVQLKTTSHCYSPPWCFLREYSIHKLWEWGNEAENQHGCHNSIWVRLLMESRDSATRLSTSGFFMNDSPEPLSTPLKPFANLFKNLQRYSQLKVDHRWQMEKSSIRKVLIFFWHLWVVELIQVNFFL
jgi:hypothetical protein